MPRRVLLDHPIAPLIDFGDVRSDMAALYRHSFLLDNSHLTTCVIQIDLKAHFVIARGLDRLRHKVINRLAAIALALEI